MMITQIANRLNAFAVLISLSLQAVGLKSQYEERWRQEGKGTTDDEMPSTIRLKEWPQSALSKKTQI